MKVNIELVEGGKIPKKGHSTDVGLDCFVRKVEIINNEIYKYYLGFKIEIPEGFGGFLFPRSSIKNFDLTLTNSVGVIDPYFSDEVTCFFKVTDINLTEPFVYELNHKCCQLVILPLPSIELEEVVSISEKNTRSGYGSTGL